MNLTDIQKERLVKAIKYLALAVATAVAMALGLTSCNVTRTIITESKSLTKGDTAIIIQTKTIESYNAKSIKKRKYLHISAIFCTFALYFYQNELINK